MEEIEEGGVEKEIFNPSQGKGRILTHSYHDNAISKTMDVLFG